MAEQVANEEEKENARKRPIDGIAKKVQVAVLGQVKGRRLP